MRNVEPFYGRLGEIFAEARARKGWSQAELGRQLRPQLTKSSIAYIEAGRQRIYAHTLFALAEVLGVSLGEIAGAEKAETRTAPPLQHRTMQELREQLTGSVADAVIAAISGLTNTSSREHPNVEDHRHQEGRGAARGARHPRGARGRREGRAGARASGDREVVP